MALVGADFDFDFGADSSFSGAAQALSQLLQVLQQPDDTDSDLNTPRPFSNKPSPFQSSRRPSSPRVSYSTGPSPLPPQQPFPSQSRVGGSSVLRSAGSTTALSSPAPSPEPGQGRASASGKRRSTRFANGGSGMPASPPPEPPGIEAPRGPTPPRTAAGTPVVGPSLRSSPRAAAAATSRSQELEITLRAGRPERRDGEEPLGPSMRKAAMHGRRGYSGYGGGDDFGGLFMELEQAEKAVSSRPGGLKAEDFSKLRSRLLAIIDGEAGSRDAAACADDLLPPASQRSRLNAFAQPRAGGITPMALTHRSDAAVQDKATEFVSDVVDTCFDLESILAPGADATGGSAAGAADDPFAQLFGQTGGALAVPTSPTSSLPSARWTARAASAAAASAAAASAAAQKAAVASAAAAAEATRAAAAARAAAGRYNHIVDYVFASDGDKAFAARPTSARQLAALPAPAPAAGAAAAEQEDSRHECLSSDTKQLQPRTSQGGDSELRSSQPTLQQDDSEASDAGPYAPDITASSSIGLGEGSSGAATGTSGAGSTSSPARSKRRLLKRASTVMMEQYNLNVDQPITEEVLVMVLRRLDIDPAEGQSIWSAVDEEMAGLNMQDTSYPLSEFLDNLQVDLEDYEGIAAVINAANEAKAKLARGENDVPSVHERGAIKTMYNKIVKALFFVADDAPAEQAWDFVKSGKVRLSRAERQAFEEIETAGERESFTKKVAEYMDVSPVVSASAGQTVCKEACIEELNRIVQECKAEGKQWTDPDWDMMQYPESVLYVDRQTPGYDCTVCPPADFKRLTEIVNSAGPKPGKGMSSLFGGFSGVKAKPKKKKPCVFKGGVKAGDIVQGQIGTCFLLGAIGAIAAHNAKAVENMFIKYDVDVGIYGVRFCIDGEWWYVLVDDVFPVDEDGELLYARCKDPEEVWVPLLEKAYCKLHTCFEMCDGGIATEAINLFFGGVYGTFRVKRIHKRDPARYFKEMKQARDKGWLLTSGFKASASASSGGKCGEAVSDNGLVAGHAYSVLKVMEVNGHKLVCCRNPWGQGEWTGLWSDDNNYGEWTDEMIKAVGKTFDDDGRFWMSIEDFVENTTGVDYARTFGPNWKKTTQYKTFRKKKLVATAVKAYSPSKSDELALSEGDQVEVQEFMSSWWTGVLLSTGERGVFPMDCVEAVDRPVARFDLVGTVNEGASSMTVVVMLMQPNIKFQRKFTRRREDGLNYKDTTYPDIQLLVVGPDGSIAAKRDGKERVLWMDLALPGGGLWKIYALSTDATGGAFTLRVYMKDGLSTLTEISGATFSEVQPLL